MPVDLRKLPVELPLPQPPRWLYWWCFAAVISVAAGIIVLLLNLNGGSQGLWFWCQFLLYPILIAIAIISLRLHRYERDITYTDAFNDERTKNRDKLIQFAQRPFYILSHCAMTEHGGWGNAKAMTNNLVSLEAKYQNDSEQTLKYSVLPRYHPTVTENLVVIMGLLINDIDFSLITGNTQKVVALQIDLGLSDQEIISIWEIVAKAHQLNFDHVVLLNKKENLFSTDRWLDSQQFDLSYVLIIAININAQPSQSDAESASAFLLAGCELKALITSPVTALHRPVQGLEPYSLLTACQWADVELNKVTNIWTTGIEQTTLSQLEQVIAEQKNTDQDGTKQESHQKAMLNIDQTMGYSQHCCGWLALASAIDLMSENREPQMIVSNYLMPAIVVIKWDMFNKVGNNEKEC